MKPFAEKSERSEDGESNKIAEDTEDELTDTNVKSYFRTHMVSSVN